MQYTFIWPKGDLDLQQLITDHDRPLGALGRLRTQYQVHINVNVEKSLIIFQGMVDADVTAAARSMVTLARYMVAQMANYVKLTLIAPFHNMFQQAVVSLDEKVELNPALYLPPGGQSSLSNGPLIVGSPKVWSLPPASHDQGRAHFAKVMRNVDRFNQKIVIEGLQKTLSKLNFASKGVQMRVNLGQLALVTYSRPADGVRHHTMETFRRAIAKDRTDILLRG